MEDLFHVLMDNIFHFVKEKKKKKNSGEAMAGSANKKKITSVTPRQFIAVFDEFLKGLVQMITPLW